MTLGEFLIDDISSQAYGQPNFLFWVRTVIDAMTLLGPETDADLERLTKRLLSYYVGADISPEDIDGTNGINREIGRLGITSWKNQTPLAAKYRTLWAIAFSRERNLADLYDWQYGVVTAFQTVNYHNDKDQVLIELVRSEAAKYGIDLYAGKEQHRG